MLSANNVITSPEIRLTHNMMSSVMRCLSRFALLLSNNHHNALPRKTPATIINGLCALVFVDCPSPAKMPINARMVMGLVTVKAKVDR